MNNIGLKLCKERNYTSVRTNDLVKMEIDDFPSLEVQVLYEKGLYYHKRQNGIIKVSKYEFNSLKENRFRLLNKKKIQIDTNDGSYDYIDSEENKAVWYVNFAGDKVFSEMSESINSMEAVQLIEMPLLYNLCRSINNDFYCNLSTQTFYKDGKYVCPTPILFEKIPHWFEVISGQPLDKVKPVTKDKRNNIISMQAPYCKNEKYTRSDIDYLCQCLIAGFGGIMKQAKKSKISSVEIHTGNWGCGIYQNNPEVIYLSQMLAASLMGVDRIVFHKPDEDLFLSAKRKFCMIVDNFNYEELVAYIEGQNYSRGTR